MSAFKTSIQTSYGFSGDAIDLGHALEDGMPLGELPIRVPLRMMNRHGLIAGSTGTGKTRTLQLLAEGLSRHGVPSFVADVKGDLAGISEPGPVSERLLARVNSVGGTFQPQAFPVEFFSLSGINGTQIRATVSSFGPVLLGKVLDLSETQQSVLAMVFKYCDDRALPLLDFKDLRDVLLYLGDQGKGELKAYGAMSTATLGVLIRKMVELEQQGAGRFFGEPELDISDLMRTASDGRGIINILTLADVQDRPRLYSTFLMWLLGQFYYGLPEAGDLDKPKLVFFFDEAHLLFKDSSSALVEHIEQVARLIRSKGIGVFFITQTPKDVSEAVLAQLGNRIQHAFRAFTPNDAKNLRATASTFPRSSFYKIDEMLTSLGTGEALITVLNPKGVPTETVAAQICAPSSLMSGIAPESYGQRLGTPTAAKYREVIDRESAHEILKKKLTEVAATSQQEQEKPASSSRRTREPKSTVGKVLDSRMAQNAARQVARTVTQQIIRGIFGMLKK
ncbi:MAG TPA: helicase HerA-like domain-containing protein [Thermoanaerobaculia bacterium]|nr:helicase HerA-like domain-containing protein [Thermoanaerobaculia bacterium]